MSNRIDATTIHLKLMLVDLDVVDVCKGCFFYTEGGKCGVDPSLSLECDAFLNGIDRDLQWIEVDEKGKPI